LSLFTPAFDLVLIIQSWMSGFMLALEPFAASVGYICDLSDSQENVSSVRCVQVSRTMVRSGMRACGQSWSQCVRHPSGATYDPSFLTRCSFQLPVSRTCFGNACIDKRYETQVHSSSFTLP
jgi:hypothetical protein